ncbi:MAG: hypothetical protein ABIQ40_13400 [Bacteroidia bacterium]
MASTKYQFVQGATSVLTTFTHKTPKLIRLILSVLAIVAFLSPIVATINLIINDREIKFGLFGSFIILWSAGYYMIRIVLWNSFGKEVITFDDDKVTYYCDYKYFQGSKKQIKTDQLKIELVKSGGQNDLATLCFTNADEKIEMVIPVSLADLRLVEEKIRINYA